ncbi:hypothetical protein HYU21_02005 [Candidatus Woesearchaeota archaeon]|nr:hypothetical protein [Candidatus Woesearchaeota archaeon]
MNKLPFNLTLEKKAQVRLTETIGILLIFIILVGLGFSFYAKYQKLSLIEKEEQQLQARAVRSTLKALFLPEVLCSRGEAEAEENCVDMSKVRALKDKLSNFNAADKKWKDYYFNLFSFARISVHELYPYPDHDELVLYDYPKEGAKKKENTFFVVSLKDEVAGGVGFPHYGFGYIEVVVYS